MEGSVFKKNWRNLVPEPVKVFVAAVSSGLFVGMVVLEPLYAYLNMSVAGRTGWIVYAIGGACGWLGWFLVNKARKKST